MYIMAGMSYKERFEILKTKKGKNNEIKMVFDKLTEQFAIQDYDMIDYHESKEQAEQLFNKC